MLWRREPGPSPPVRRGGIEAPELGSRGQGSTPQPDGTRRGERSVHRLRRASAAELLEQDPGDVRFGGLLEHSGDAAAVESSRSRRMIRSSVSTSVPNSRSSPSKRDRSGRRRPSENCQAGNQVELPSCSPMIRPRLCSRCTACGVRSPNSCCTDAVGRADSLNDATTSAIRCSFSSRAAVRAYLPALWVGASTERGKNPSEAWISAGPTLRPRDQCRCRRYHRSSVPPTS